ncbi:diguanylate cyclase [Devosia sp.]|uniref:GGDEF domain-containing protein n=1 Tax=Devosia sp. TaxID=1871048 RepID=UPI003F6E63DF
MSDPIPPVLDQTSLLIAIGFSATALMLTLVITWLGTRQDHYLLSWGLGLGFIAPGSMLYGWFEAYDPAVQCTAFALLLAGFAFIYVGCTQFSTGRTPWRSALIGWTAASASMAVLFAVGLSGVGTMVMNVAAAGFFLAAGREHWLARANTPLAMLAKSALYGCTAVTFALCAIVLFIEGQWVLTARPHNWAEDLNSIALLAALAAAGAVTMALHQFRITEAHRRLAMTDALTGLLNRRALFSLAGSAPVAPATAVIMLDLDDFKTINDRFGHALGDEVLVRFSAILSRALGPEDVAARLGGEEFCLVIHATSAAAVHQLADGIRLELAGTQPLPGDFGPPTVSAGIAIASPRPETFDELLRAADELLYRAKDAGRNRVHGPELRLVA